MLCESEVASEVAGGLDGGKTEHERFLGPPKCLEDSLPVDEMRPTTLVFPTYSLRSEPL